MKSNIMKIDELLKMINEMGYIDCKKDDYDDTTYESIMCYLKFCENWFLMQKLNKLSDEFINGASDIEPKGILSILDEDK